MNEKTAIIYARVSTRGQADDGLSIPEQIETCETYVKEHGLKKFRVFDEAASAFKGRRTGYYEMLSFIETKRPGHLVFLLPDRLSRSPEAFEDLINLCRETKHNLILHDVYRRREFGIINPEAFEELAALRKEIIDGGLYSARMRFRVGRSVKRLLEQGFFPGYPPVGYRNIIGARKIVIDEERAPLVSMAFNLFSTGGYSLDDVWARMLREGLTVRTPSRAENEKTPGRPISRADMWRTLKNSFYTGRFAWGKDKKLWDNRGVDGKGKPTYPPLISQELFEKVQEIFKRNLGSRMIRTGKPFLYRGLLECRHCGCQLVGDGNPEGPYTYYHCTSGKAWDNPDFYRSRFNTKKCPQKIWKEKEITAAVEKALADVEFDQQVWEDFKKQVMGEVAERHEAAESDLKTLRKRRTELENKIEKNLQAKIDGRIDPDELPGFRNIQAGLKAELEEINGRIGDLEGSDDTFVDEGLETLEMARDFLNLFKTNDLGKTPQDNLADRKVLAKAYFRKIIAGDPLNPDPMYEYTWPPKYNGLEFVWEEPFNTLWETKVLDDAAKRASQVYAENRAKWDLDSKKWRGRRDSNSRPPA